MATMVGAQSDLKSVLYQLVALDYDAVDAYQAAIDRLKDAESKSALTGFKRDHERHVQEVGAALRALGGDPPHGPDAKRVLVFSESSHWDTNWLQTSEEYFRARLEPIFAKVMRALERDPERVYCIESVFFLRLYWERHPEDQHRLARLLQRRQLRILSAS